MSIPADPDAMRALEILASLERQLRDASRCLDDVAVRALGVAAQTDWKTDAAWRFHASAEAWRRRVAALAGEVDRRGDDLLRLRVGVAARVGQWCP